MSIRNKTVPATVINLAEIRCVTPAVNGSGSSAQCITAWGGDYNTKLKFFYRNDAAVLSVTPNHATEGGGEAVTSFFEKCHRNYDM